MQGSHNKYKQSTVRSIDCFFAILIKQALKVGTEMQHSRYRPFYFSRATIHPPYLLLGLYQARTPSAASRHKDWSEFGG